MHVFSCSVAHTGHTRTSQRKRKGSPPATQRQRKTNGAAVRSESEKVQTDARRNDQIRDGCTDACARTHPCVGTVSTRSRMCARTHARIRMHAYACTHTHARIRMRNARTRIGEVGRCSCAHTKQAYADGFHSLFVALSPSLRRKRGDGGGRKE
jgi:hypothetical protein